MESTNFQDDCCYLLVGHGVTYALTGRFIALFG